MSTRSCIILKNTAGFWLKLMHDSGIITLLKRQERVIYVKDGGVKDACRVEHSTFETLTADAFESIIHTVGYHMQSWCYHASHDSRQTPGMDHFTALG